MENVIGVLSGPDLALEVPAKVGGGSHKPVSLRVLLSCLCGARDRRGVGAPFVQRTIGTIRIRLLFSVLTKPVS